MTPDQELRHLLTELRVPAPADGGPAIDGLRRRLDEQVLRVLVAGEVKRDRSTPINALITAAAETRTRHRLPQAAVRKQAEQMLARARSLTERFDDMGAQPAHPADRSTSTWLIRQPTGAGQ